MTRIRRHAVVAGGQAVAALVNGPDARVAIAAERAQRAEPELVVIAPMRRVVVGDRRRGEAPSLAAQGAERIEAELLLGPGAPALQAVPLAPMQSLRRGEVSRVHAAKVCARLAAYGKGAPTERANPSGSRSAQKPPAVICGL
jgi:hypothetical protein